ncbi:uncharacterized protein LOC126907315 isoform X1 [Daktulosphaira vitifoliae]|uniref:uncharacterized protein LOC126907315 isoform X1 n=1 Tax=Daktulosphaira vitifoliae TaxID=58002 RepID=UPI0021AAB855|nr:uncharacterized protein LOC126907315 isoform X1 [Daktulosphaira vitifoliae]
MKIQFAVGTFIWLVSWTTAIDISMDDLNHPYNTINESSVTATTPEDNLATIAIPDVDSMNETVILRTKMNLICEDNFFVYGTMMVHCYRDVHCRTYEDCCKDSIYYKKSVSVSRFGCHKVPDVDMVLKTIGQCPPIAYETPRQRENRNKCEKSQNYEEKSTVRLYPVTSLATNLTYKNAYCALCNGETNVIYWKPVFRCFTPKLPERILRLENASDSNLLYRNGQWYHADYDNKVIYECTIQLMTDLPVVPLRRCASDGVLVNDCPNGDDHLTDSCRSSANEVYEVSHQTQTGRTFRNLDCALCNNVSVSDLLCVSVPVLTSPIPSIQQLFRVKQLPCNPDEIYDVIAARCRNIIRESGACSMSFFLTRGEYDSSSFENGTVYAYVYKKRLEYVTNNGSSIKVCVDSLEVLRYEEPISAYYLSYISLFGSSISVMALLAHLILFTINSEPKNLPEKNLASLCFSLLIGYCCSLSSFSATKVGGLPCILLALTMHFGFLASFAWMSVMAIDVWIVLYASTKKLRLVGGKRNKRFILYSAFAWLTPAAFTASAASLQWSVALAQIAPELKPNFQHTCWFRNPQSLVALFIIPAGATIVTNYITFIGAVKLIATSSNGSSLTSNSAVNRSRKNMKIYSRLSLMMGLAWIIGLVGALTDNDIIWAIYAVLNSLQGAFIFLAFDYSYKVFRILFPKLPNSDTQSTGITPLSTST